MSEITIRRATKRDIDTILLLAKALQDFHTNLDSYYGIYDEFEDHRIFYEEELENDERLYLIASVDEKDVAFASASVIHIDDENAPKIGYLIAVYMREAFRERGIGTLLYEERVEWLKEQGVFYIEMSVDVRNKNVLKRYKERGFREYKVSLVKKI